MQTLIEMRNIYKFFGGLCATNNVSLTIGKGEVVGLVGDNAAGPRVHLYHWLERMGGDAKRSYRR